MSQIGKNSSFISLFFFVSFCFGVCICLGGGGCCPANKFMSRLVVLSLYIVYNVSCMSTSSTKKLKSSIEVVISCIFPLVHPN